MSSPLVRIAQHAAAVLFHVLLTAYPVRRHVVISAFPRDEGNAVEVVRTLLERYRGRILWIDAPDSARLADLGLDDARITRLAKRSPRAVLAFLGAEAVFTTHGLYGCPRPVRGKAMVNLWHGDGPKRHAGAPVPSSYLVSGSGVFGRRLADAFALPHDDLLLTGLPRTRQLCEPTAGRVLADLGIEPDRPFVVWMPTVRQFGAAGRNRARSDTADPAADRSLAQQIEAGVRVLDELGIQVVVKPHPVDLVSRTFDGFAAVSDDDLTRAGTTVYSFLGASAGLLTDYSSVWTDYLALDRPIGFFTPDLAAYLDGRGVHRASLDDLPGPTLVSAEDFARFGRAVLGDGDGDDVQPRQRAREIFELTHSDRSADALLDELSRRGALPVERVAAASGGRPW